MGRIASVPGVKPVSRERVAAAIKRSRALAFAAMSLFALSSEQAIAQPANVQPDIADRERREALPQRSTSEVTIPSIDAPRAWQESQSVRFVLNAVRIDGNKAIDDQTLSAPFAGLLGKEISVAEVFAATEQITRIYAAEGYALSLAFVPAQDVRGGIVVVHVIEGFVGEVVVHDADAPGTSRWNAYAERLTASRPLKSAVLERELLLIGDQAGVKAQNFFERMPNGEPGAMRLVVNIERKTVDARVELNNRGSRAIGPIRAFVNFDLNDVLGMNERLGAFGVTTLDGRELVYVGGRLQVPLWVDATLFAIEVAHSDTKPGTAALTSLEYQGRGWTGSASLTHTLIRSLKENLYLTLGFAYKNLKSQLLGAANSHDKISSASLAVDYDTRDRWGGLWRIAANVIVGLDILESTQKNDPLSTRLGASGRFVKVEGSVSHLMSLSEVVSLYGEFAGQFADGPLLVSEQCGYGGGYIGRAFDPFELTGDHCVKARAEMRFDLPVGRTAIADVLSSAQFYVLADAGVMIKAGRLLPTETRTETAESIGWGWRFRTPNQISGFVEVAHPLDRGIAASGGTRDTRIFFGLAADY